MIINIKQTNSLSKVLSPNISYPEINDAKILAGEHFSYQIIITSPTKVDTRRILSIKLESEISDYIKLYAVKDVPVDLPSISETDTDYITKTAALVPDLLIPLEDQNGYISTVMGLATIWVEVSLPEGYPAGKYGIDVNISETLPNKDSNSISYNLLDTAHFSLELLPLTLPKSELTVTQWFHVDCIASAHRVGIYSEEHWALIEKYIAAAAEIGISLLLTPVITPPLDTACGTSRPITQLVDVELREGEFVFEFSKLRRYIELAKKYGIYKFEISHFFSQWGCHYAPNVDVKVDGEIRRLFGWHVLASDPEYARFLKALIPALLSELDALGVKDGAYFHISDEPSPEHVPDYMYASKLLKPLIGDCKVMDAISNLVFSKEGLIDCPVCATNHIEPFIEEKVPGLWAYYCCGQHTDVSNRFISMPSARTRVIGLQMYKFDIEGFLQWGFNFYNSQISLYEINPYITTSADGIYSSGDAFTVYPGKDGPYHSIRGLVFREALEDISLCRMLEERIGKDAVVKLIDEEAGLDLRFASYPKNEGFIPALTNKIKEMLIK